MDSNGNQWDKHHSDRTYNHASFKRGAASSSSNPPSEPEKGGSDNESVDQIHPQPSASRGQIQSPFRSVGSKANSQVRRTKGQDPECQAAILVPKTRESRPTRAKTRPHRQPTTKRLNLGHPFPSLINLLPVSSKSLNPITAEDFPGSKEKASPNPPQPDRFDGSQARDDSHEAKASQHQASFKPAATGAFQGIVSVVTAPFRWLEMLWSLMIAFGWAIVQNFPSVLLFLQTLLALIAAKFGKGTVVQIKDWVSDSAGTVAGSAKAILDSKHADVLEAYGWNKDIPYEKLPPVLPLVIHIEIWEPGLKLAFRDVDSLQPLIPDLDLGDVARKKKQMPIEMAKKLKKLNSLFVSQLTKSLGPSRIVMTELLWKIEHHPVKDILYSDMKASTSSLDMANKLKGEYDIMVQKATESDDDTFRLWLSAHDLENTAGGQAVDEDQIAWSKALTGMSNTYSNVKAVCETISLDKEIFMEASKLMADEIKHLKKAINSLETTQNNLKGFDDEQFNVDYARRVETKLLAEEVRTWLDVTKKYYGKDSEEE
ncbi:hypothetical protein CDV36_000138 [Fusarium kuroshium]|uniref:Uncharacterized protein n=1 Tax=Fusarium kuroshium TaxID=2010991 RepID=A0A3M2SRW7_9HYPO|nr:hypothetical protein CDV36_000138 [Fusarium kuroshium]